MTDDDKRPVLIFCYAFPGAWKPDLNVQALCEDGTLLAAHISSCTGYAKRDIGIGRDSGKKHERYREHCPDGYELVWFDESKDDPRWHRACELNKAAR